jgi:hypothetical protein
MIDLSSFRLNKANIKPERLREPQSYFVPIAYELGFLREYEKRPGPNEERIMADSWNKSPGLEPLKNLLG